MQRMEALHGGAVPSLPFGTSGGHGPVATGKAPETRKSHKHAVVKSRLFCRGFSCVFGNPFWNPCFPGAALLMIHFASVELLLPLVDFFKGNELARLWGLVCRCLGGKPNFAVSWS